MRNLKVCLIALLLSSSASAIGPPFAGLGVGGITGNKKCEPSPTTASGSHVLHSANSNVGSTSSSSSSSSSTIAPPTFCSGELIFEDTFDTFDVRKWQHESTLAGGSVRFAFHWTGATCPLKLTARFHVELGIPMVYQQPIELVLWGRFSPRATDAHVRRAGWIVSHLRAAGAPRRRSGRHVSITNRIANELETKVVNVFPPVE